MKPNHSRSTRSKFSSAIKATPYRKEYYTGTGTENYKVPEELKIWLAALTGQVAILKTFLDTKEAKWKKPKGFKAKREAKRATRSVVSTNEVFSEVSTPKKDDSPVLPSKAFVEEVLISAMKIEPAVVPEPQKIEVQAPGTTEANRDDSFCSLDNIATSMVESEEKEETCSPDWSRSLTPTTLSDNGGEAESCSMDDKKDTSYVMDKPTVDLNAGGQSPGHVHMKDSKIQLLDDKQSNSNDHDTEDADACTTNKVYTVEIQEEKKKQDAKREATSAKGRLANARLHHLEDCSA